MRRSFELVGNVKVAVEDLGLLVQTWVGMDDMFGHAIASQTSHQDVFRRVGRVVGRGLLS